MKAYSFKNPMLRKGGLLYDTPAMVCFLEVRIRETEEHLLHCAFPEVVRYVAHGIRPKHCHIVVVLVARLCSQSGDLLSYEIDDLVSDLNA